MTDHADEPEETDEPGGGRPGGAPTLVEQVSRLFVDRVPHNAALGMVMEAFGNGRAVSRLPYRADLVGHPATRVLHGGAVTSVIDATCGASVFAAMRSPTPIATLDLRIDYLRPSVPGRAVTCKAHCDKITRNVAFARGRAHDGDPDDPVATAAATFMIFGGGRGKSDVAKRIRETAASTPAKSSVPAKEPAVPTGPATEMSDVIAAVERARHSGNPQRLVEAVPYANFVGMTVRPVDGRRVATMAARPSNIGNATLPALHGGTIGGLLESVAAFEVAMEAETITLPKTITLTIDYLRSARVEDTHAVAEITRQGRRVASVSAVAWQEDRSRPIATAVVHLLTESPTSSPSTDIPS